MMHEQIARRLDVSKLEDNTLVALSRDCQKEVKKRLNRFEKKHGGKNG